MLLHLTSAHETETEITVDAPEFSTAVPEILTSTVNDSDLLTTVVDNADNVDDTNVTNIVDEKFTTNMEPGIHIFSHFNGIQTHRKKDKQTGSLYR